MKTSQVVSARPITLPSDQNASGRSFGDEELELLRQVIATGTLTSTKGEFVKRFEHKFSKTIGTRYAHACSSGTAALHAAIAAINPDPGDEIVTTAITDMGALTPIIYQTAVPVFADVDPCTFNVTAQTILPCLSERTKAIIVTHLFGNPCEMQEIMELAQANNIPVIEDCAQAYLATCNGRKVGTIGDIGCFSLQQGKHITTGEGGLVCTDDPDLARRVSLFINKAWGYGDPHPDHYFLALNYRMSELQGAVALAQLSKLKQAVRVRIENAARLTDMISGLPGVEPQRVTPRSVSTYWKYCLGIDGRILPGGAVALAKLLRDRGIPSAPRYIQKPAFQCEIFKEQRTFGTSRYPFTLARPEVIDYTDSRFPGTFASLERALVLPWNERYEETHVAYMAASIQDAVSQLRGERQ